jgi:hypothetical protein
MENKEDNVQSTVNQIYEYAVNLMVKEKKNAVETKQILIEQGLDEETASIVVSNLEGEIKEAKKVQGNKDMFYGALWCVGGFVATAADIGFIFWGAIVFGGIQFFKGLFRI